MGIGKEREGLGPRSHNPCRVRGLLPRALRSPHLQQRGTALLKSAKLESLQVDPAICHDEHHVELVVSKHVGAVVLGPVLGVPRPPCYQEGLRVSATAHAHRECLDEARRLVVRAVGVRLPAEAAQPGTAVETSLSGASGGRVRLRCGVPLAAAPHLSVTATSASISSAVFCFSPLTRVAPSMGTILNTVEHVWPRTVAGPLKASPKVPSPILDTCTRMTHQHHSAWPPHS